MATSIYSGSVEVIRKPLAKVMDVRDDRNDQYSGEGQTFNAENASDCYNLMLEGAKKFNVPVKVFCPDLEKGRKGGFTLDELSTLDMSQYTPKLFAGRWSAYMALLKFDDTKTSEGNKTVVL
tara:strand:+ start:492 stop:857 length:366 start_codon:yes stop_codon:yes gene_type:complete